MVRSLEGKRYDSQVALFVGIDFERKGGPVLLRAWRAVRAPLPDAELWVVGPKHGPPEPGRLTDALVSLLSDPERAALMGRRGHAEVLTEHTWDRVADRMAPYLEQAAAEPIA
jgi:glycosyltransferase involved in cell wall biosynthesis